MIARSLLTWLMLLPAAASLAAQADPVASRSKGSPGAPVTVYEMSDFQCPYCKRHAEQTFPALEREYIATGKVRWIFINFPLNIHRNAPPAAEFAMCSAREGKFWPAHDILFRRQSDWSDLSNPANFLLALSDSLKLPRERMRACLTGGLTREAIKDDAAGAIRSGATSTPTFYIEGGLLVGALPVEIWRPILDSVYKAKTGKQESARRGHREGS